MNTTEREQQAVLATLGPLGDYIARIGLEKGLSDYSRAEILGLVETIVNAYHQRLQTFYSDETPR